MIQSRIVTEYILFSDNAGILKLINLTRKSHTALYVPFENMYVDYCVSDSIMPLIPVFSFSDIPCGESDLFLYSGRKK